MSRFTLYWRFSVSLLLLSLLLLVVLICIHTNTHTKTHTQTKIDAPNECLRSLNAMSTIEFFFSAFFFVVLVPLRIGIERKYDISRIDCSRKNLILEKKNEGHKIILFEYQDFIGVDFYLFFFALSLSQQWINGRAKS